MDFGAIQVVTAFFQATNSLSLEKNRFGTIRAKPGPSYGRNELLVSRTARRSDHFSDVVKSGAANRIPSASKAYRISS
jgi:hypothetical protein